MTQSKNGILLVVIATIFTAMLILMTDRDNTLPSTEKHAATVENETTELKIEDVNPEEKLIKDDEVVVELENIAEQIMTPIIDSEQVAAPEGPFKKSSVNTDPATNLEPNAIASNVDSIAATSTQHALLNHIIQPIWMDQKLGDFRSLEKDGVVFKMMPSSPAGLQGENPKQVITSKSDKYAPTTISENYNYQQMPMYNGGYYIAPMPSYLMRSVLPGNTAINSDQQK